MLPERWRAVPGWPGYQASDRGRVRSVPRRLGDGRHHGGQVLEATPDRDGYLRVTLRHGARRKTFRVGWLVMLAHAGPAEVLHGNGDRQDNRLANLRFGSRLENERDKRKETERKDELGPSVAGSDAPWDMRERDQQR